MGKEGMLYGSAGASPAWPLPPTRRRLLLLASLPAHTSAPHTTATMHPAAPPPTNLPLRPPLPSSQLTHSHNVLRHAVAIQVDVQACAKGGGGWVG